MYPAAGNAVATLKLNGKLVALSPAGGSTWASGGVRVEMRHPGGVPSHGEAQAVLILRLTGAPDELGFAGVAECP